MISERGALCAPLSFAKCGRCDWASVQLGGFCRRVACQLECFGQNWTEQAIGYAASDSGSRVLWALYSPLCSGAAGRGLAVAHRLGPDTHVLPTVPRLCL